jgi:hypothetical protein
MQTLKLQTIYSESVYNFPEFNQFIGEEVEITIKKIKHKKANSKYMVISELQKIVQLYNTNNFSLSEELIKDRKKESNNE